MTTPTTGLSRLQDALDEIERLKDRNDFLEDRIKHNRYCSAAGWPCSIHCEKWTSPS